jgi:Icc protein
MGSTPFLLVQLSDAHIGADWGFGDPVSAFRRAVDAVAALRPRPDAVLLSGDLADSGSADEYAEIREQVASLGVPAYALPGNHDDRAELRRQFGLPGSGDEPVQYAVDLGPVRLVLLDTLLPGEDSGQLDAARLAWLDAELAAHPETPTLVALHHPPLVTGMPVWDGLVLPAADRHRLAAVVERHPQVRRLVTGHVHRVMTGEIAGRPVLSVPSTYVQARLDFRLEAIELEERAPAGFAVHAVTDGQVTSHIEPVW